MSQTTIERRFCPKAGVALEKRDDKPIIRGHAAVYYDGTPDTEFELWPGVVERIMPGSFDRAIAEDDVRALFNHEPDHVLGRNRANTLTLRSDSVGLLYSIEPPDTALGRDVTELIRRGDVTGSSFAFMITDEDWRKADGVEIREIRGVELFDVGPVTYPAYTATDVGVRSKEFRDGLKALRLARDPALAKKLESYRRRALEVELATMKT